MWNPNMCYYKSNKANKIHENLEVGNSSCKKDRFGKLILTR